MAGPQELEEHVAVHAIGGGVLAGHGDSSRLRLRLRMGQAVPMDRLTHSDSVIVACPPDELYAMVSDITRMGEWSPVCKACWWDEGEGPRVGAWFTGRNELPERTWETRSEVVAADPGREFAFVVHARSRGGATRSRPSTGAPSSPSPGSSCRAAMELFGERFGDDAPAQIDDRVDKANTGIPRPSPRSSAPPSPPDHPHVPMR